MSESGDPGREELAAVKEGARREIAELDAALAAGRIDEQGWQDGVAELVRGAYLKADTPWGQSGHRGPEDRWTKAREIVVDALDRDGTFLDGGCANGYLMECVHRWAGRRGLRIEPYGVDIVPELAELARQRLPGWADRIWTGNLLTWMPPRRFDAVRIGLEYAPPTRRHQLVGRTLTELVTPGGQLLIGPYTEETDSYDTVEAVREWGYLVGRMLEVAHPDVRVVRRLLVLPAPAATATVTSLDERRRRAR